MSRLGPVGLEPELQNRTGREVVSGLGPEAKFSGQVPILFLTEFSVPDFESVESAERGSLQVQAGIKNFFVVTKEVTSL